MIWTQGPPVPQICTKGNLSVSIPGIRNYINMMGFIKMLLSIGNIMIDPVKKEANHLHLLSFNFPNNLNC